MKKWTAIVSSLLGLCLAAVAISRVPHPAAEIVDSEEPFTYVIQPIGRKNTREDRDWINSLSNSRLIDVLRAETASSRRENFFFGERRVLEHCLSEITRRGGKHFERVLNQIVARRNRSFEAAIRQLGHDVDERPQYHFARWDESVEPSEVDESTQTDERDFEKKMAEYDEIRNRVHQYCQNLELVTALRRLQGRPDPIQVFVNRVEPDDLSWPELPVLDISIRNVDTLQQEVGFQAGGHYRSGRFARCQVNFRNYRTGEVIPLRSPPSFIGGGQVVVHERPTLMFGEGWNTTLRVEDYVERVPAGDYLVEIYYHNTGQIDNEEGVFEELICCRSKPFPLTIETRLVGLSKDKRIAIRQLLASLDDSAHPVVIDGRYGSWAYEVVAPRSPVGRVLSEGWDAVPDLLELIGDEATTPELTAHALAMLYSITGLVDPIPESIFGHDFTETGALGSYEYLSIGWSVGGDLDGRFSGGGRGFGEHQIVESTDDVPFDSDAVELQEKLVSRWMQLKSQIEVVEFDDSDVQPGAFGPGVWPFGQETWLEPGAWNIPHLEREDGL